MEPDWSKLQASVRGHMAENDDFFGPDAARALEAKLQGMGKDVTLTVHPGTGHAFMAPHNALGTLDDERSPAEIWPGVVVVPARTARLTARASSRYRTITVFASRPRVRRARRPTAPSRSSRARAGAGPP